MLQNSLYFCLSRYAAFRSRHFRSCFSWPTHLWKNPVIVYCDTYPPLQIWNNILQNKFNILPFTNNLRDFVECKGLLKVLWNSCNCFYYIFHDYIAQSTENGLNIAQNYSCIERIHNLLFKIRSQLFHPSYVVAATIFHVINHKKSQQICHFQSNIHK